MIAKRIAAFVVLSGLATPGMADTYDHSLVADPKLPSLYADTALAGVAADCRLRPTAYQDVFLNAALAITEAQDLDGRLQVLLQNQGLYRVDKAYGLTDGETAPPSMCDRLAHSPDLIRLDKAYTKLQANH
jgi:hypothetical protein